jgi:hypothetical protein
MPSLEWLERVNSRVILLSALMVGVGFFAGVILNVIQERSEGPLPWSDPVIWSSALMLAWLVAAAVFNAVYRPARRGRKVAYLTIVSLLFLVVALSTLLWVNTEHGGKKRRDMTSTSRLGAMPALRGHASRHCKTCPRSAGMAPRPYTSPIRPVSQEADHEIADDRLQPP